MKTFKALKKPSTGGYWIWANNRWMTSDRPDLLNEVATIEDLKSVDMFPLEAGNDAELVEVVVMDKSELGRLKKDFIKEHPLGLLFHGKRDIKKVRQILKEANEHYVLEHKEDLDENGSRCQIDITCPTTSFASAYYHVGAQIGKEILSKRKPK